MQEIEVTFLSQPIIGQRARILNNGKSASTSLVRQILPVHGVPGRIKIITQSGSIYVGMLNTNTQRNEMMNETKIETPFTYQSMNTTPPSPWQAIPQNKPGSKRLVSGIGIALSVLFGLIIIGSLLNGVDSSATGDSAPPSASSSSETKQWVKLATIEGEGIKNTPKFTVGSEWRITWDTRPGKIGDGNFQIFIYKDGSDYPDIVANVIGASNDESFQYNAGTYHLQINALQPYIVEIWDKR